MRRIIERTVTIVTTTILRISWQEDSLHASHDPQPDPSIHESPQPDISQRTVQHIQQFPPLIEAKEVSIEETEPLVNQSTDIPPNDS